MPNDKDIKIRFKTTADTSGAEDTRDAIEEINDEVSALDDLINKAVDFEEAFHAGDIEKARKALDGLSNSMERLAKETGNEDHPGLEQLREQLDQAHLKMSATTDTVEEHADKVADYILKAQDAAEALEDKAKAADKVGKKLDEINIAQHIQLAGQFATGLRSLSRIAKDSGQDELAEGLEHSAEAMNVVAGAAAGGLNLSKIIEAAGGARAALGKAAAFMTGPMGIALAAAAAAWLAINEAVEHYSEISDRALESNAKSAVTLGTSLDQEKAARERAQEAADEYLQTLRDINTERENERANISSSARIELAELEARKNEILERIRAAEDRFKRTGGKSGLSPVQAELRRKQVGDIADSESNRIRTRARNNDQRLKGGEVSSLDSALDIQQRTIQEYEKIIEDLQSQGGLSDKDRQALADIRQRANSARSRGSDQDEVARILEEGIEVISSTNKPQKEAILRALQKAETARAKAEKLEVELKRAQEEFTDLKRNINEQQTLDDITTRSRGNVRASQTDSKVRNINAATRDRKRREAEQREAQAGQSRDEELLELGNQAVAAAQASGAPERGIQALRKAVAKLKDGSTSQEANALNSMLTSFSNYIDRIEGEKSANARKVNALEEKIKKLTIQIENGR